MKNGYLYSRVWNLTPISTSETLTLNTWHYIGYIYDTTGNSYIYVDGKMAASGANSGTRGSPGATTTQYDGIGRSGGGTYMQTNASLSFSLGSMHVYKRALSAQEVFANYAATAPRFLSTPFPGLPVSGSAAITTTQGVSSTYSTFAATSGTGIKVLGITPTTAGITIDTSTVNSALLNIASSVTSTSSTVSRIILETITAVDSVSAITNYQLTITVNPPVTITPAIATTISTTFGKAVADTFTASYGTGTYTFSNTASSYQSAFTITKTAANTGVLTVANNLPAGTYVDTITVTDSVGAVTNYPLTVVVNPVMTLIGSPSNTISTTVTRRVHFE
jgi:hypothetical protein